jgi:hypothetical protein
MIFVRSIELGWEIIGVKVFLDRSKILIERNESDYRKRARNFMVGFQGL